MDLTADRAGFLIAHDLETAMQVIRASGDASASIPVDERVRELTLFSVGPGYLKLRAKLSIAIDS